MTDTREIIDLFCGVCILKCGLYVLVNGWVGGWKDGRMGGRVDGVGELSG